MPKPLAKVRILLSSRVIFDLEEADRIFAERGAAAYADFMRGRGEWADDGVAELGGRRLGKGALWNFVAAAGALNEKYPELIDIAVICKDTAETALPIFRNLDVAGLNVGIRIVNAGQALDRENLDSYGFDLFLSRNAADVQFATDQGVAAALINFPPDAAYERRPSEALRFCMDGDSVTFGSSAEVVYQKKGLAGYRKNEFNRFAQAIEEGPFTQFLAKLSRINADYPAGAQPFLLSLLTARGETSCARALTAVEKLGIVFNDRLYFSDGRSKPDLLKTHLPDIFFDDQQVHLQEAALFCPTGHVPYKTDGPMHKFQQKKKKAVEKKAAPKPAAKMSARRR